MAIFVSRKKNKSHDKTDDMRQPALSHITEIQNDRVRDPNVNRLRHNLIKCNVN